MAITHIKGTVNRVFYQGKGAEVVEKFNVKGQPISKYWTVWFDEPHGLSEGDEVDVSGLHGDELNEWEKEGETRRNVKRSISKARIKASESVPSDEAWSATPEPVVDQWQSDPNVPF